MGHIHYAHTLPGEGHEKWEPLSNHLQEVGELAEAFAASFGAAAWGKLLGLWHDLGKYSQPFQDYIRHHGDANAGEEDDATDDRPTNAPKRVDHSTFGAQHAVATYPRPVSQILAFCIAGHHSGLPDASAIEAGAQKSSLTYRLALNPPRVPAVTLPTDMPVPPKLVPPFPLFREAAGSQLHREQGMQLSLLTRMLFSCLVDADRTATEAFCNPPQAQERRAPKPELAALLQRLDKALEQKSRGATGKVNQIRQSVLSDCIAAASLPPGFFTLNVPTGGGKTLSSMAFALRHAISHDLRRVIVAIPFTSIIEQTADVYRNAFDDLAGDAVIEHHSNIDPRKQTRQNMLATENWDAPIIVTTNVQLYESLFASRTSQCRKLHRIAGSVIILDEAQTIPLDFIAPTLAALRCLVRDYGCTIVFCTATQPALQKTPYFNVGIDAAQIRPIIADEHTLHASLKRVIVERVGKLSDDELVHRLAKEQRVLCIVNARPHASRLYDALASQVGKEGCYHLSTFMCAEHRREKLAGIRDRLKKKLPCRVISTQLIEAGVDVDFPCVYRAVAGFDAIAQAAGRCNREGTLEFGRVYVFDSDQPPPAGLLRDAAETAGELTHTHADPLMPGAVQAYFELLYARSKDRWDSAHILTQLEMQTSMETLPFQFRAMAESYRLINDQQVPILVPYGKGIKLIEQLNMGRLVDYQFHRDAQRYIVGVREQHRKILVDNQVIVSHESGLFYLNNDSAYSPEKGMLFDQLGFAPDSLTF